MNAMAEPLAREAESHDGPLFQAAQRLERALARLEAAFDGRTDAPPLASPDRSEALVVELDAARRRQRELAAAASSASAALGRAMSEVRRTLDEDAERQGAFDFASSAKDAESQAFEAEPPSAEEVRTDEPPSEKEPAA
jgi:hypothetical protein